jgi:hypothetical protein
MHGAIAGFYRREPVHEGACGFTVEGGQGRSYRE